MGPVQNGENGEDILKENSRFSEGHALNPSQSVHLQAWQGSRGASWIQ